MRAIRFHEHGGPEVLKLEDVTVGDPGPGEARLHIAAAGVNFVDVYQRSGLYPMQLPAGLGVEAAGRVEAVGAGVDHFRPGDRVAFVGGPGCYAEARVVPADRLVRLPDAISDRTAAGAMLKGLTAQVLIRRTYPVKAGDVVLWHAAAGGVGLIAIQWLKALGATVIGTVGSDEKAALARAHGCDHAIVYTREDFVARVREITGGEGVPVVYDSVGKTTFAGSIDCLRPLGMMVTFGNASGPVPPLDPLLLSRKGSLYLTRPSVFTYVARRADLERSAAELLEVVGSGAVKVEVGRALPLAQAAEAHRALEARATTGSLVLEP
ncbi:Alcohol dehydrogenase zinc-binding domain protein [Anaeromyxobacter dehalogenans 2CP-1]|uniref:Alcohol dehydrogenase zinc-binding domain protein n=1 Tax=Anaeromyxobacter dehalogenans (strain ATCC BAA-258 / DSM 21875 / 2CP-1) TaxID=455488 RepID=B8JGQ8_ANAD2|nr:quinone oxidoreductase [Anaeromyxobacter dehalogenans]ACL66545.1 Alcohol dehydrogenase zinc-binding domain protein [Anaeromyxobacter dehalogenans 2CP-1]